MQKRRRRAAGRPSGPPDSVTAPPGKTDEAPIADTGVGTAVDAAPAGLKDNSAATQIDSDPAPVDTVTAPVTAESAPARRRRQRQVRGATDRAGDDSQGTGRRPERAPERTPPSARTRPADAGSERDGTSGSTQHPFRDERRRGESSVERSLRALVSTRTTQLPPTLAMRAREVATPSPADLAAAEADLVIVRRHYVPPAPLVTAKMTPEPQSQDDPSPPRGRADGRRAARRPQRGTSA